MFECRFPAKGLNFTNFPSVDSWRILSMVSVNCQCDLLLELVAASRAINALEKCNRSSLTTLSTVINYC